MALTDTAIRNAKSSASLQKLFDGNGLYLLIKPNGSRLWRLKYRLANREKLLALGVYPTVSLKDARNAREDARRLIASGVDPAEQRKKVKLANENTFESVATEYIEQQSHRLSKTTLSKAKWQLREFLIPAIGKKPINELKASDMLKVLRRLECANKLETARKTKELAGRIFRYAVTTDRAERDPTGDLRGAIRPPVVRSHAAITEPRAVGELLRAIDGYQGQPATAAALKLAPHVFLRPGELRAARWHEIYLDSATWRVAAERTKMRREHLVPLSSQALAILREIHTLTGQEELVFPAIGPRKRPISENSLNAALRRLGYGNETMVSHGFRAMASTLLNELGFAPDVIELQLAHKDKDSVRAVYNRAARLSDRKKMMQQWSDYLDRFKNGNVVRFVQQP